MTGRTLTRVGTYDPLYVDAVVSNPPYSQNWNPQDKENEPRYKEYGLAPKGKADYAFLLHDLYHIKPDGIMTIVLPHGVLFRGGEEGEIRKHLIENNKIDTIIGLPANIFFGTGIPTIIMVLKQKRVNTDVLIIDASKGFEKVGKNNKLRASDIKRIVDTVTGRKTIAKYSRVVSRDEVRKNDYNLNIPRYVDSSEKAESWDIYASMYGGVPVSEVEDLAEYWAAFPSLKDSLFTRKNAGYLQFVPEDIKSLVFSHPDTEVFEGKFKTGFGNFGEYLNQELITDMERIPVSKEENTIATELFRRLSDVPLVDPYEAYQILDQNWAKIAVDLEIIQTEGAKSITVVDPNMVIKKKDNKETEVQEGWIGRVLPFELVQKVLLSDDVNALKSAEERLAAITSDFDSLLEELPEDEKSKDFVNDDSTAFVPAAVKKALKAKDEEPEVLAILKKVDALVNEEKSLKKDIKEKTASLQITTKKTIESLSEEDALALLSKKWIEPMVTEISALPLRIVDTLTAKLEALAKKYQTTFEDVEKEIADTEASLTAMIDQLTGSEFDMQGLLELKKLLGGE